MPRRRTETGKPKRLTPLTPQKVRRVTDEEIEAAIRNNRGLVTSVARALNLSREGVYIRLRESERLQAALAEAREYTTDRAESALFSAIERGEGWAVCFYLKTQGRDRGYVERQEHTGEGGGAIRFTLDIPRPQLPQLNPGEQ